MRAIIVDDEYLMIHKFTRLTAELDDLELVEGFDNSEDALESFMNQARKAGWTIGTGEEWLQLDRRVRELVPGMIPEQACSRTAKRR